MRVIWIGVVLGIAMLIGMAVARSQEIVTQTGVVIDPYSPGMLVGTWTSQTIVQPGDPAPPAPVEGDGDGGE